MNEIQDLIQLALINRERSISSEMSTATTSSMSTVTSSTISTAATLTSHRNSFRVYSTSVKALPFSTQVNR